MADTCGTIAIGELTALHFSAEEMEKYQESGSATTEKIPGGKDADDASDGVIDSVLQVESSQVSFNTPYINGPRAEDISAQRVDNLTGWLFDKMWQIGVNAGAAPIEKNSDLAPVAGVTFSTEVVKVSATGGLMFYVKMPENASADNVLQVTFAITAGGITNWNKAQDGSTYFTLAKGEKDCLTQGLSLGFLHCKQILYRLSY